MSSYQIGQTVEVIDHPGEPCAVVRVQGNVLEVQPLTGRRALVSAESVRPYIDEEEVTDEG